MKIMYCWRCHMDVPMLDEEEYEVVLSLYGQAAEADSTYRQEHNLSMGKLTFEEQFRPVCEAYEKMTGYHEKNVNAIMHHRILIYGPPCSACGKPIRTPRAKFCAACGNPAIG